MALFEFFRLAFSFSLFLFSEACAIFALLESAYRLATLMGLALPRCYLVALLSNTIHSSLGQEASSSSGTWASVVSSGSSLMVT